MTEIIDASKFSGRPMEITALLDTDPMLAHLPSDAIILAIEGARESLPLASKLLIDLQVMHMMLIKLKKVLLLETLNPNHEHVEVAEQLAQLVTHWQSVTSRVEATGTRIACLEPGRLEWYGVVDQHLALYSWRFGEEDIEWYHPIDASFLARKPLIEA